MPDKDFSPELRIGAAPQQPELELPTDTESGAAQSSPATSFSKPPFRVVFTEMTQHGPFFAEEDALIFPLHKL